MFWLVTPPVNVFVTLQGGSSYNNVQTKTYTTMTKKEFKERCSFHAYGKGKEKRNAIFFDWKQPNGFKFMVKARVQFSKRNELFNILYDWVIKGIEPDWYIQCKSAPTDQQRFKVPLMG